VAGRDWRVFHDEVRDDDHAEFYEIADLFELRVGETISKLGTDPSRRSSLELDDKVKDEELKPGSADEAVPSPLPGLNEPPPVQGPPAIRNHAAFIWTVADLLRGDYKQSEYGKVILPLVVLRRLDCVLEPTKEAVLARFEELRGSGIDNVAPLLEAVSGEQFYNTSKLDLPKLLDDPANIADNLHAYIQGFSPGAREVLERFDFAVQIDRLNKSRLLYLVVSRFCDIDLHPAAVSNLEMGYLYEELIASLLGTLERDGRRALHAEGGHPADGEPAVH
jgi:HsdM N-terminal domain